MCLTHLGAPVLVVVVSLYPGTARSARRDATRREAAQRVVVTTRHGRSIQETGSLIFLGAGNDKTVCSTLRTHVVYSAACAYERRARATSLTSGMVART